MPDPEVGKPQPEKSLRLRFRQRVLTSNSPDSPEPTFILTWLLFKSSFGPRHGFDRVFA